MPYLALANADTQDAFNRVLLAVCDLLVDDFPDECDDEPGAVLSALVTVISSFVHQQPPRDRAVIAEHLCDELLDRALERPIVIDPDADVLGRRQ